MKEVFFNADAVSGSPDTAEWHAWRAGGIGWSDAPILAAAAGLFRERPSWLKSQEWFWKLKTGQIQPEDLSGNFAVLRGKRLEPIIRAVYERTAGASVMPTMGEMDGHDFVRSSFDGVDFSQSLIAEFKAPGEKVISLARKGIVVDYYRPQLMHQSMTLWGHPEEWEAGNKIHFVPYDEAKNEAIIVEVDPLDLREETEKLLAAERKFWMCVLTNTHPDGDIWLAAAQAYKNILQKEETLKAEKDAARNVLTDMVIEMNLDQKDGAGLSVKYAERSGAVNYDELLADIQKTFGISIPEEMVSRHRKKSSFSWVIREEKPKRKK